MLDTFGFTAQNFWAFIMLGITLNLIGTVITFIAAFIKGTSLREDEIIEIKKFTNTRTELIKKNVHPFIVILKFFEMFFPMHDFILSIGFVYYVTRYKGLYGFIMGRAFIDKYSLIPIVRYNFVRKE